jgi:hypothetical protein
MFVAEARARCGLVPLSAVLGVALMSLSVALVGLEFAAASAPPSCIRSAGSFFGLAMLMLTAGFSISISQVFAPRGVAQPPNPRLQRTRAALLRQSAPGEPVLSRGDRRAPLSRQPLGDKKG